MKVYVDFSISPLEFGTLKEPSSCHVHASSISLLRPQSFGIYLDQLIRGWEAGIPQLLTEGPVPTELLKSTAPGPGFILSTSGTTGERSWIFHSYFKFYSRLKSSPVPEFPAAIFLSMGHAAGIESFFTHYYHNVDCGVYPPSVSPAKALEILQKQKPAAIKTTPSTLKRLLSYPKLKSWIQSHIRQISLGGEEVSSWLMEMLNREMPEICVRSVFGTTESWSVQTQAGQTLQWHKVTDPEARITSESGKLQINSPFLFTHHFDGNKFIAREKSSWSSGDLVEMQSEQFRIIRPGHRKYHGLKVFPEEWSSELTKKFKLPWVDIVERQYLAGEKVILGYLPLSQRSQLELVKSHCREAGWPVFHWSLLRAPQVSIRGKRALPSGSLASGSEILQLLKQPEFSQVNFKHVEEEILIATNLFTVIFSPGTLLFYQENPYRRVLQYVSRDEGSLLKALERVDFPCAVKLPVNLELKEWIQEGAFTMWELDLTSWNCPAILQKHWGEYNRSLSEDFDQYLKGIEGRAIQSIAESSAVIGQTEVGSGLCAFWLSSATYHGLYMHSAGLPLLDFARLCAQALSIGQSFGMVNARTSVLDQNVSARMVHQMLGFKPQPKIYRLWRTHSCE